MNGFESRGEERFQQGSPGQIILVEHPREVHVYQITEPELESLVSAGTFLALSLSVATALFGVAVTLWTVLLTVDTNVPVVKASLIIGAITFTVLWAVFSVCAGWAVVRRQQALARFKAPR